MRKIIAYPLSVIYVLFFGLALLVFHPIQWVCLNVFGYQAHKTSVDWLQFFIMRSLNILGTRFTFTNNYELPNAPLIVVANHQSMFDIPPLIWYLRKHHVKFVSKKELGSGIPSVSYNLRHGGSVLIERKNPRQAILAIKTIAEYIEKHKRCAVIFPEGTRSRTGVPKSFKTKGIETIMKYAPNAYIVPITINNSWKTHRYGKFPMGIGAHLKFKVHEPLKINDYEKQSLLEDVENIITKEITP
jgi:1-acyl-sn-glycerol-3-phosphate acyltransferase